MDLLVLFIATLFSVSHLQHTVTGVWFTDGDSDPLLEENDLTFNI